MACRGVYFSLSGEEVEKLRALNDDRKRRYHVSEVIEPEYFERYRTRLAETDKAWDAMHRALSEADAVGSDKASPLDLVVLGGERLHGGDDYIIVLKTKAQVAEVAAVLPNVSESDFRRRYFAIDATKYEHPLDDEDFGYTWAYFSEVRDFWLEAASEGRFVLFTVDQ